jgi:ankyrin repeat protein
MDDERIPPETLEQELHVALCDNDPVAVRKAIERGADPNARRTFGSTPLWFVTFHGKPESLAVLLDCGATVPKNALAAMGQWEVLDWQVADEKDALRYLRIAQALLERGADPNVKVDEGKSLAEFWSWLPPLHLLFTTAISKYSSISSHKSP